MLFTSKLLGPLPLPRIASHDNIILWSSSSPSTTTLPTSFIYILSICTDIKIRHTLVDRYPHACVFLFQLWGWWPFFWIRRRALYLLPRNCLTLNLHINFRSINYRLRVPPYFTKLQQENRRCNVVLW